MSKREHYNEQDYVEWLKSLGCVLCLPLSEEGDLQDRISGLSLQLTGYGSIKWDTDEGMYLATQPSVNNQAYAVLRNGMSHETFLTNKLTSMVVMKKKSTSGTVDFIHHNQSSTVFALQPVYNGTGNVSSYPTKILSLAQTISSSYIIRYHDGVLYSSTATPNNYIPLNWQFNKDNLGLFLGHTGLAAMKNTSYYIKEIYVFNQVLDERTIKQIQGL